jgi:type VII secretion integral membrane protein EccD
VTAPASLGLAKVTVATPRRRLDVALPEAVPVNELLPHLLRHAGEGVADDGEKHGGWSLRRATGGLLEPARNLAAQGVRDGDMLHLVPRRAEWPEPAYDDVVEIIASGSRRAGRSWGGAATRRCALASVVALLALGVVAVGGSGPPFPLAGLVALGLAGVLAVTGILLARALPDGVAGAVVAGCALPYAGLGGLLVAAPPGLTPGQLGAPHLLLGSMTMVLTGVAGYVGVGALARIFVAGIATGLLGTLAALLCLASMTPAGAAAVALTVAIGLLPGYPLLAVWLGRLPVPALPERPEEMLQDQPTPARSEVFVAVNRAHELLTGFLHAAAVVSAGCAVIMMWSGQGSAVWLAAVGALALMLRARLFAVPRQRVPLLASGAAVMAVLLFAVAGTVPAPVRLLLSLSVIVFVTGLVLAAGLVYSRRAPSPYVGRAADILDIMAIMALLPLTGGVVGLYSALQGLFATLG